MARKRRLIETLEIQIAVPDPAFHISAENMLAEWGACPYAQLSVLLVHLRFVASVHQTHHWIASGDSFYADHQLYERLYDAVSDELDSLAEKAVGLGGIDCVNLPLQILQLNKLSQAYGTSMQLPQASSLSKKSLAAEVGLLRCIAHCSNSLQEVGLLTRGLDNFLQGLEDNHEKHVYLLKQRSSKVSL